MVRSLLFLFVNKIRKENLEIGYFSTKDIFRIFTLRLSMLIRGLTFLFLRFKKPKLFFLGCNSSLVGLEKINFGRLITVGNNVKISSIGSDGFYFGDNFVIRDFSIIDSFGSVKKESGKLIVGNNVGISEFCYVAVRGDIHIGDDVIFGPGVKIFSENHSFKMSGINFRLQDESRLDVKIGNNIWVGSNAIILPGVIIEDNVVIAAGSVVTKNLKSGTLYAGVPAKKIKNLN